MRQAALVPLLAIGMMAVPAAALAQSATLTVKDGRALVMGGETTLGADLQASTMGGEAIVDEFVRLCLPDPAGAVARTHISPLGLTSADAVFAPDGKNREARISRWASSQAELTVWSGDDAGLKGRAIAILSRAYVTTGSYGSFKASGTQCNLVVGLPDFAAAGQVVAALTKRFGTAGKLVTKNTFTDGYWIAGDARINVNVPTTRSGVQPLHLSAQLIGVMK